MSSDYATIVDIKKLLMYIEYVKMCSMNEII